MALRQPHYLRTRDGGITIGFLISVIKELKKKKTRREHQKVNYWYFRLSHQEGEW